MLGDIIKKLRTDKGLTQTELARRLYVTPGAVSQWEKGLTKPDMERLVALAREFRVPLDTFSDEPLQEPPNIDEQLVTMLMSLPADQVQRVKDFVAGMKAASRESPSDHQ